MKRLLSLLAILSISTPIALSVTACGHSQAKEPVYNSIEDGVKSLKLNSYVPVNDYIKDVKENLKVDIIANLLKLKFADAVKFKYLLTFERFQIINISKIIKSDGTLLSDDDLTSVKTLKIQIICEVNNNFVTFNNEITLNIIEKNKTDQKVVDYMLNTLQTNFNNILNSFNLPNFAGYQLDRFEKNIFDIIFTFAGGSYLLSIVNTNKLDTQFFNGETGAELSQSDINQAGNLKLIIEFDYGDVKNQSLTFNINLAKFDFTQFDVLFNFDEIDVKVKNPENLTEDDVTEIYVSIIAQILKTIENEGDFYWTIDDFAIQGAEKIVYEGADFSAPKVVVFDMVAQPTSKMLTGTLKNNFITVNVTTG